MPRKLEVVITGDTKSLDRALSSAGRSTKTFGSTLGSLAKGGAIGAAIGGVALLGKGLVDSVGAAKEAEQAQTRLQSALESANVSYATHGAAIDAAIQKTSKLAALDDEDLSDAFAKLVRTTGDVTKATEGMNLAADIARARNIDLEKAVGIVEKAHVGQTRGLKAVGVELEKGATATEALEKAQEKFGGAAERYGNQATASQERLGVAFENLQEKVGQKVLPVLAKLSLKLIDLIDWAEKNWPKFAKAIEPVVQAIQKLGPTLEAVWNVMRPILAVAIPAAFKVIAAQVEVTAAVFEALGKVVARVVSGILVVIDKFLGGVQAIAEAASKLPFVGDKFRGIADQIGSARERVRSLQYAIDSLHSKEITVTVNTVNYERTISSGSRGGRAAGGPVQKGVPYMVGERGREMFVPNESGQIIPNNQLRVGAAVAGGGVVNFNFPNYVGDKRELMAVMQQAAEKFSKQNSRTAFA